MFPTELKNIQDRINRIDPDKYAYSRNYKDGKVTCLSPYISRGVISTKQVFDHLLSLQLPWNSIEKLAQELAWRDYWQQIWIAKGDAIDRDLKHNQHPVSNHQIPKVVIEHCTGIEAVDDAIKDFYKTGYMHNHMRMYVASITCNIAQSHWYMPAKWMYYHLLDGDWASNALSWQWVSGSNANKKYYANQENINKHFNTYQQQTFLDVSYDQFSALKTPKALSECIDFDKKTILPESSAIELKKKTRTLIYNYYNLNPEWYEAEQVQRILLLEPSFFQTYPVSDKCIQFMLELAKNIPDIKVFIGEFATLAKQVDADQIIYKEHPTNKHYKGKEELRTWMFDVRGYYPSFFAFWKKCKKQIGI